MPRMRLEKSTHTHKHPLYHHQPNHHWVVYVYVYHVGGLLLVVVHGVQEGPAPLALFTRVSSFGYPRQPCLFVRKQLFRDCWLDVV